MNTVVGASKLTHPAVTATSADLLRVEDLRVVFPTATGQSRTVDTSWLFACIGGEPQTYVSPIAPHGARVVSAARV